MGSFYIDHALQLCSAAMTLGQREPVIIVRPQVASFTPRDRAVSKASKSSRVCVLSKECLIQSGSRPIYLGCSIIIDYALLLGRTSIDRSYHRLTQIDVNIYSRMRSGFSCTRPRLFCCNRYCWIGRRRIDVTTAPFFLVQVITSVLQQFLFLIGGEDDAGRRLQAIHAKPGLVTASKDANLSGLEHLVSLMSMKTEFLKEAL